jgi:glycosyltransferase involved in cell wall biosynthesis
MNNRAKETPLRELRIAVLFWRLGPYHHARLSAAGKLASMLGVELCTTDQVYAWNSVDGSNNFRRVTLLGQSPLSRRDKQRAFHLVKQKLNQFKPEAIAIPGWSYVDALGGLTWSLVSQVPAILMSDSTAQDKRRVWWKEWVKRRIVRLCSSGLAAGRPHADYLSSLGMPRDRIFLGYDVVDNEYFAAGAAKARSQEQRARTQYGLPEKYFLASARFVEKKNLLRLIEAYGRYRTLAENAEKLKSETLKSGVWDLVLLGDGPLRPDIFRLISGLRLDACVHLPGFKQYPDLPVYYGLASAFIHASTTEPWGLVVNEAMASGLPVLVSNRCGCATDLVQEGKNGFTFDPINIEQLAQLMLKISDFKFPLSTFGTESQHIISNWGPERFADGLTKATLAALNAPKRRANWLDRLLLWMVAIL